MHEAREDFKMASENPRRLRISRRASSTVPYIPGSGSTSSYRRAIGVLSLSQLLAACCGTSLKIEGLYGCFRPLPMQINAKESIAPPRNRSSPKSIRCHINLYFVDSHVVNHLRQSGFA